MSVHELPAPQAVSLAAEIAYQLQRDILEGRIGLGDHLAQDELCVRFQVSRTPVREALTRLAASSLVELRPNRGAVVRRPGQREVGEIYELRAELEGYAAQRAAVRIDRTRLRQLARAQQDLAAIVQDPGGEERSALAAAVGAANDAVHDLVLAAADNRALATEVQRLRGLFPKDYVTEAASEGTALHQLNVTEHDEIVAALSDGDGPRARRAMTDHVTHAGALLMDHLLQRRFWG